jgi:hypothetical protein
MVMQSCGKIPNFIPNIYPTQKIHKYPSDANAYDYWIHQTRQTH